MVITHQADVLIGVGLSFPQSAIMIGYCKTAARLSKITASQDPKMLQVAAGRYFPY